MGKGRSDRGQQSASPQKRGLPRRNRRAAEPDDFAPFAAWDGDDFSRVYGDYDDGPDEPEDSPRTTVVIPAITLPGVPAVKRPADNDFDDSRQLAPVDDDRVNLPDLPNARRHKAALAPANKKPRVPEGVNVVLVPGSEPPRRGVRYQMRRLGNSMVGPLDVVRKQRKALTVFALAMILMGVVANTTGLLSAAGLMAQGRWNALASFGGPAPTATPRPAPDYTDPAHYVAKYGFDTPTSHNASALGGAEWNRLVFMLPFAYQATAAYDQRYHQSIEPEMIVWWTHAEGIKGHINYSNCANNPPRAGYTYFSNLQNCPHASFWQLGYGNQFSVIYVLKNAFRDLHGDPNNPQLVQKVGQWVLNYDRSQGTVPACGGYSCTFPARTIDSIMSGIDTTTGVQTQDNWWASVLSRDPAINCYMIAHALTYFNHEATKRWIGNYYYEPYWGWESNKLGDVLAAWLSLRRAAHI